LTLVARLWACSPVADRDNSVSLPTMFRKNQARAAHSPLGAMGPRPGLGYFLLDGYLSRSRRE